MTNRCTIFFGNVHYDVKEEEILTQLSVIGKVVNFRVVYDRISGKSKGYGFAEYETPLLAEIAVKTLKISFFGRAVKINYADQDAGPKDGGNPPSVKTADGPCSVAVEREEISRIDKMISVISSMDKSRLKSIVLQLKVMSIEQPTRFRNILENYPMLGVALFQVSVKLNLVSDEKVSSIIRAAFDIKQHKLEFLRYILGMSEDDLLTFDGDIRKKLAKVRSTLTEDQAY